MSALWWVWVGLLCFKRKKKGITAPPPRHPIQQSAPNKSIRSIERLNNDSEFYIIYIINWENRKQHLSFLSFSVVSQPSALVHYTYIYG